MLLKMFAFALLIYVSLFFLVPQDQIRRLVVFFLPESFFLFLTGALLHFLFCYVYFYFIQVMDRSPSTRMMADIERSASGKLDTEQIRAGYSIDKKIDDELEDMVILGSLKKEGSVYKIPDKKSLHLKIFVFVRDYLKLRRS